MPIKRPHKKSRYGCDQCRKRRVKCNEVLPSCSTCIQRGDKCEYSRIATWDNMPSTGPLLNRTPMTISVAEPTKPPAADPIVKLQTQSHQPSLDASAIRFRELELMHHWSTKTCDSFADEARGMLQDWAPTMALQHPFMMEALLAMTSFHIACECKSGHAARPYASDALQYQNRASLGLRTALDELSPNNCDAVLISSIMISVCAMVSPLLPATCEESARSIADIIKPMIETLRGVGSVLDLSRPWIEQGPLAGLRTDEPDKARAMSTVLLLDQLRHLNASSTSGEARSMFTNAINTLEQTVKDRDVISWIAMIEPSFLDKLQEDDSLALAILLQWAVQMARISTMWWSVYAGRMLVEKLSTLLFQKSEQWSYIAMWSREQIMLPV